VVFADLLAADSLRGQPITEFSSPSILGTDKANRDRRLFTEAIDKYIAEVAAANAQAIKRFARDGRDADGNPLFPVDRSMSGERFAQTRTRILQSADVQNWSGDDLQYAIYEVFARHGQHFDDKKISDFFAKFNWYHPRRDLTSQQIEERLSDIETQNTKTLLSAIAVKRDNAERAAQAERERQAAVVQQKRQQAATRAQQQAAIKAQQDEAAQQAAALIIGGFIQGILNHRK
jgi:hypothetical protein